MKKNPTWSVTVPSYNSAKYIEETLNSVLIQDPGLDEMEIIVVDNCSTDDTRQVVERVGKGRVIFYLNEKNLGPHGNFNRCIEKAKGKYIHMLHSDDIAELGFYSKFYKYFEKYPDIGLVSCNAEIIDENGIRIGTSPRITSTLNPSKNVTDFLYENPFRTPGIVVKKTVYDKAGGFDISFTHCGDWDMWVRAIKEFGGVHIDEELCKYRQYSNNDTSKYFITGEDLLDSERVFQKFWKLGYGINKEKCFEILKNKSKERYLYLYSVNKEKKLDLTKIKQVFKKYNGLIENVVLELSMKKRLYLGCLKYNTKKFLKSR